MQHTRAVARSVSCRPWAGGPLLRALASATLAVLGAAIPLAARAQAQQDGRWHGGLSLGGSAATGNTKSRVVTGNAEVTRESTEDKITLRGLLNNARSQANGVSTTTANLLRLGGRYDNTLSEKWFTFSGVEGEHDEVQGLQSRWNVNTGLGYRLIRNNDTSWDGFFGVGYSRSAFSNGSERQGAEFTLGEESTHRLTQLTSIKQRWVVFPGPSSVGTRSTLDVSLATTLIGAWTMNAGWAYRYNSNVPTGNSKSDSLLTLGMGYKF